MHAKALPLFAAEAHRTLAVLRLRDEGGAERHIDELRTRPKVFVLFVGAIQPQPVQPGRTKAAPRSSAGAARAAAPAPRGKRASRARRWSQPLLVGRLKRLVVELRIELDGVVILPKVVFPVGAQLREPRVQRAQEGGVLGRLARLRPSVRSLKDRVTEALAAERVRATRVMLPILLRALLCVLLVILLNHRLVHLLHHHDIVLLAEPRLADGADSLRLAPLHAVQRRRPPEVQVLEHLWVVAHGRALAHRVVGVECIISLLPDRCALGKDDLALVDLSQAGPRPQHMDGAAADEHTSKALSPGAAKAHLLRTR